MRQVTCPVCSSAPTLNPTPLGRVACGCCGVSWTYLPEPINPEELYRDEIYAVVDNRQSLFEKIIFSEAKKVLLKVRTIHPDAKQLLDFGSGKGQFLAVAMKLHWEGLGIETEKTRADFAREYYGVSVKCEFYKKGIVGEGHVDLITLNHVLEHLPQPMAMLEELVKSNLTPDGLLYLEVPRADSWQAKIAGNHWMHWDIPKHLTHWTEQVLSLQLQKIGFDAVARRKYSIHLGVLGMLQALLSKFGFRENLILRLKRKKTPELILLIGLTLPFALLLEGLSVVFDKSGVVGLYFRRQN